MNYRRSLKHISPLIFLALLLWSCGKKNQVNKPDPKTPPVDTEVDTGKSDVEFWLTNADQSVLFSRQKKSMLFTAASNSNSTIEVDDKGIFQTIDGFGYTLNGGSASLINGLSNSVRQALLTELFATDGNNIGVSYLRISVGASDLDVAPFTYNDLLPGQTDLDLKQFSLEKDRKDLLPVLKQILAINPNIKIMGSPWTAPAWMKTNNSFKGGSLKPEFYNVYSQYLVKYIQEMKAEGVTIDALTPQNEPLHGGNNPSMVMTAFEQRDFIKNHLGPAFKAANINTKIIIYDHNADRPDYPLTILNDPEAKKFVEGSAFHLYGGNISALSTVRDAHPDKGIYFTEQWIGGPGNFRGDLGWHMENIIVGASRNWSKTVLEWNLAADPNYRPFTDGGCSNCMGALTIGSDVKRNTAYYIIAHASKFVRPGSVRIISNNVGSLPNVAFKNPDGKKILIVLNKDSGTKAFNIKFDGKIVSSTLNGGAVGTYVW